MLSIGGIIMQNLGNFSFCPFKKLQKQGPKEVKSKNVTFMTPIIFKNCIYNVTLISLLILQRKTLFTEVRCRKARLLTT